MNRNKPKLSDYAALFFDMNGTFMFAHDRLDEQQDFYRTYLSLGGHVLSADEVQSQVLRCCAYMRQRYEDANYYNDFPRLHEALQSLGLRRDTKLIAAVIAAHEMGEVPAWASMCLQTLAQTHQLALVSNVWADGENWRQKFQANGLANIFHYQVYSSDLGVIKPAPAIFLAALSALALKPDAALFIGDSLERDILPAKALGFTTVLVGSESYHAAVDFNLPSISDLFVADDI